MFPSSQWNPKHNRHQGGTVNYDDKADNNDDNEDDDDDYNDDDDEYEMYTFKKNVGIWKLKLY